MNQQNGVAELAAAPGVSDDLGPYLHYMVQAGASDLFLSVGAPPTIKIDGRIASLGGSPLQPGAVKRFAYSVMSDAQRREFERELECDLGVPVMGLGRFRVNVYVQRGEVSLVVRHVKSHIPGFEELRLPKAVEQLALLRRGLVLVVGAAGSGKSTTLAAMLEYRNQTLPGHILTVEDPIEFVHRHKRCIVDQREVGLDTRSFHEALRHVLRQAPDVIMIGEIRDEETMRHALHYAETGHLCLSTLHANNANQAIERIIHFFPEGSRHQVLMDLSMNLRGVIAQRLIEGKAPGRVLASEMMLWSSYIAELIQKGEVDQIKSAIAKSGPVGMHTFDQSLYELFRAGAITMEQALEHADSKTDLSLRIRLSQGLRPDGDSIGLEYGRGTV
ncbi:PilT/PilU family type 4a pilus ATPase [Ramlibacter sp. MAHUQ-53]|uniref:PilT/PilU family type 4a pilus ATPase n=1 Tax=unclassified Ramlibacter TaxID=2617605 RepID=UPI00363B18B4